MKQKSSSAQCAKGKGKENEIDKVSSQITDILYSLQGAPRTFAYERIRLRICQR